MDQATTAAEGQLKYVSMGLSATRDETIPRGALKGLILASMSLKGGMQMSHSRPGHRSEEMVFDVWRCHLNSMVQNCEITNNKVCTVVPGSPRIVQYAPIFGRRT